MAEIHADMTIDEVLEVKPHAKEILFEYGLLNEGAVVQSMETLSEAASAHELDDAAMEEMMERLKAL